MLRKNRKLPPIIVGSIFGRLTTLEKISVPKYSDSLWMCRCSCGVELLVRARSLTATEKGARSCGCYRHDRISTHSHTVSRSASRTYKTWQGMRQRCSNPKAPDYVRYGMRGITVCGRWDNSFEVFLSDMGNRPEGRSLDRIDNNGNYSKENCKWSTPKEQCANRRSPKRKN